MCAVIQASNGYALLHVASSSSHIVRCDTSQQCLITCSIHPAVRFDTSQQCLIKMYSPPCCVLSIRTVCVVIQASNGYALLDVFSSVLCAFISHSVRCVLWSFNSHSVRCDTSQQWLCLITCSLLRAVCFQFAQCAL